MSSTQEKLEEILQEMLDGGLEKRFILAHNQDVQTAILKLQELIDSAKREARIEEIKYLAQGEPDHHWYIDISDQEIHNRIAQLEQSEESI